MLVCLSVKGHFLCVAGLSEFVEAPKQTILHFYLAFAVFGN